MTNYAAFIRKGHGCEDHSTQGRCTAFDGFEIIAEPLGDFDAAARESRVFRKQANGNGGVTYGSHAIKLARLPGDCHHNLYILMSNGSGREVLLVDTFFGDAKDVETAILAMPERLQYGLLYTIWETASAARSEAAHATATKWARAYEEKRIRKKRASGGRGARIEIIAPWEAAEREHNAKLKSSRALSAA